MADENDKPQKKSKLKWILLFFFIVLLAAGAGGAWYYLFSDLPGSRKASQAAPGSAAAQATPMAAAPNLHTAMLDNFLVNLADPLGKRYIKVAFEVEVSDPDVVEELAQQKPKIRDTIIMLLSSKTYADLAPPESKLELKNEVTNRLNQILGGPKITRVFITDMVIQ